MSPRMSRKKAGSTENLLIALACGATVEAAAAKAGMAERSVYRRLEDPLFRKQLQELRVNMVERSSAMLTAASLESVKTLLSLMERTIPHATRLGAARAVLELGIKMRDLLEVEQRLAVLEQAIVISTPKPIRR